MTTMQVPEGEPHSTLIRFCCVKTPTGSRSMSCVLCRNADNTISGAVALRAEMSGKCARCAAVQANLKLCCAYSAAPCNHARVDGSHAQLQPSASCIMCKHLTDFVYDAAGSSTC
jgi:hypothetical protein